jgi:hypothetical protein
MIASDRDRAIADALDDIRTVIDYKLVVFIFKVFNINRGCGPAAGKKK